MNIPENMFYPVKASENLGFDEPIFLYVPFLQ